MWGLDYSTAEAHLSSRNLVLYHFIVLVLKLRFRGYQYSRKGGDGGSR